MDITGARWGLQGAEAILKLRATRSNGDFEQYWDYHLAQERQRNHNSHYADGVIPRAAWRPSRRAAPIPIGAKRANPTGLDRVPPRDGRLGSWCADDPRRGREPCVSDQTPRADLMADPPRAHL
jgi:hypothetical protein